MMKTDTNLLKVVRHTLLPGCFSQILSLISHDIIHQCIIEGNVKHFLLQDLTKKIIVQTFSIKQFGAS